MARVALLLLTGLLIVGCRAGTEGTDEAVARSPLETVNLRMQAYNDHDLDAFLSTYSEQVEILTYRGRTLGKGKQHLRGIFESMFEEGLVRVIVHHQIAKDGYVVNHETVVSGTEETEYISIYEVRDGLIKSVRFVRD